MHSQEMILKKNKSYFEEELGKNSNKPKELWKVLKSLVLSSDKAKKSKICLRKDGTIQFEALENKNAFKNCQGHPTNLLIKQPETTTPRLHAVYPITLNFQTCLKKLLKRFYLASITVKPLEWTKFHQNL